MLQTKIGKPQKYQSSVPPVFFASQQNFLPSVFLPRASVVASVTRTCRCVWLLAWSGADAAPGAGAAGIRQMDMKKAQRDARARVGHECCGCTRVCHAQEKQYIGLQAGGVGGD